MDGGTLWGVGVDADTTGASMRAVLSAVSRARRG
ncbi:MAG: alpha-isopropylmalate synthase regulatory domain-containing protein [Streptosporangiaceae bacterium]